MALTPREYVLLEYLLRHPDRVVTKVELLDRVWDARGRRDPNTVEVYVGLPAPQARAGPGATRCAAPATASSPMSACRGAAGGAGLRTRLMLIGLLGLAVRPGHRQRRAVRGAATSDRTPSTPTPHATAAEVADLVEPGRLPDTLPVTGSRDRAGRRLPGPRRQRVARTPTG